MKNISGSIKKKIAISEDEHIIVLTNDTSVELHNYGNDVVEQFYDMTNKCFARRANDWYSLPLWKKGELS